MPQCFTPPAGLLLALIPVLLNASPGSAQNAAGGGDHGTSPVAEAVPAGGDIEIDGRLDEAAWERAPAVTHFTQTDPEEGATVSEPTLVRILYDATSLYVGAWLRDSGPVSTRLARRDAFLLDSDLFTVALDSYHDHITAYRFSVNPSGVKRDEVISGGGGGGGGRGGRGFGGGDATWDPVWQVATEVTDSGWVAEMRIPFSQLRFTRDEAQTWGLQLERRIARKQEQAFFAFTPKRERTGVARFGHLTGLKQLQASNRLEVLPYLSARADYRIVPQNAVVDFSNPYRSGSDLGGGAGADLKYRITSNFTLNATINPDFGQVELDPAEVNLTAFETRFEEKRPFFVEGADVFRFGSAMGGGPGGGGGGGWGGGGPAQLLYSRRIGRAPQLGVPREAVYSDVPDATTILGAAKLTGRTASGWSIGLLEAVTQREMGAYVDVGGTRQRAVVEPLANYFTGRLKRDFNQGSTTAGGLVTAVHRQLDTPLLEARLRNAAYSGGVDFQHEWANRVWSVAGYFSPSHITGSRDAMRLVQQSSARYYQRPDAPHLELDSTRTSLSGYATSVDIGKRAGLVQGSVALAATSPGYEINDLGFQAFADRIAINTDFAYDQTSPGRVFRRWSIRSGPDFTYNYAGDLVQRNIGVFASGQWHNYWSTSARFFMSGGTWNDRLTRGGPLTREPLGYSVGGSVFTDPRGRYTAFSNANVGWDESGASRTSLGVSLGFKPADNWDVRVGPDVSISHATAQFVTTVIDSTARSTFGRRYVFAPLDQTTVGIETRINVTFTPELSLELYAQPFLSSGDFGTLQELRAPRTFDFLQYGVDTGTLQRTPDNYVVDPDGGGPARSFRVADRDFNLRSLRGNAVLRWEYRPGSTLFLVWQQNRFDQLYRLNIDSSYARVGSFDLARDARELFGIRPHNVLLIKASYWLNP